MISESKNFQESEFKVLFSKPRQGFKKPEVPCVPY